MRRRVCIENQRTTNKHAGNCKTLGTLTTPLVSKCEKSEWNSSVEPFFTKLRQVQCNSLSPNTTSTDRLIKENYEFLARTPQTCKELVEMDSLEKTNKTISKDGEENGKTSISAPFSKQLEDSAIDTKKVKIMASQGIQVDLFHCTECRRHIKYGKEIGVSGSESDSELESVCFYEKGHVTTLDSLNEEAVTKECQEHIRGSEGDDESESNHDQVNNSLRKGSCHAQRTHDKHGERGGIEERHPLDLPVSEHINEEKVEKDKTTMQEKDKDCSALKFNSRIIGDNMMKFVVIFLVVSLVSWVFSDTLYTAYILPSFHYVLSILSITVYAEETKSFLDICFEYLFSVTHTQF